MAVNCAMAKIVCFMVAFVLLVRMLHSAEAKRDPFLLSTRLRWVPATLLGELSESACFAANKTDDMYVAVPPGEFRKGKSCFKRIRVSCAEPFGDLGGPWQVCRNRNIYTVTVIDQVTDEPLDDDLFYLSHKAFSTFADPGVGLIRLRIRS